MANLKHWKIQLHDHVSRALIQDAGGVAYATKAGLTAAESLLTKGGAAASNPSALTNGLIEFYTADTVVSVDLYIMAPKGQFVVVRTVKPSGPNEIYIDVANKNQVAVIPFDDADNTAATEKDTGFDLPTDAFVITSGMGVHVIDIDATETIDVGLLASETGGDANGFMAAVAIGVAGFIKATMLGTGATMGALVTVDESAGDLVPEGHRGDGVAKSISYTVTTGGDTGGGYLQIPYILPATV